MKLLDFIAPYQHIIWDWNGTLIDDHDVAVEATNSLLVENNLEPICKKQHRDKFRFPLIEFYEDLGFDFSRHDYSHLCDRFSAEYSSRVMDDAMLFPGTAECLALVGEGRVQSILSAAHQEQLEDLSKHFGIYHHFDHVYGIADNRAGSKLERGRSLMTMAQVPPERTLLIGDTNHDLEVGQALGISVLLVADGHQSYERLRDLHYNVLDTRYLA